MELVIEVSSQATSVVSASAAMMERPGHEVMRITRPPSERMGVRCSRPRSALEWDAAGRWW